ncbi:MAG: ParB/RepB/Spo0J family partition protein [Litorimonas sp.]
MSQIKTAPVDMFTTLRSRLYVGRLLQDIKSIQASIARFGLLSPIVVTQSEGRLIVVDGRKRLAAMRRLQFMGRLPRSLVNIPYIELQDARQAAANAPALMSNRDLYMTVTDMFKTHQDVTKIAQDLYLSRECVKQVLTLARLSSRLRRAFFDRTINFDQAKAYAALPEHKDQVRAFMALGPFATSQDILDFAQKSEPVVALIRLAA